MEPFRKRILFCTNSNEPGKSACTTRGCEETLTALKSELGERKLQFDFKLTTTSCLGLCEEGPNLVVLPQGDWYSGMTKDHVARFVESLVQDIPYKDKLRDEEELKSFFTQKVERKKREVFGKK